MRTRDQSFEALTQVVNLSEETDNEVAPLEPEVMIAIVVPLVPTNARVAFGGMRTELSFSNTVTAGDHA
jgi:hypothetical protein